MAQASQYLGFEAELVHHDFVVDFVAEYGLDHHSFVAVDCPEHLPIGAVCQVNARVVVSRGIVIWQIDRQDRDRLGG